MQTHEQVIENFLKEGKGGMGTYVKATDDLLYSRVPKTYRPFGEEPLGETAAGQEAPLAVRLEDGSLLANGARLSSPMDHQQRDVLQACFCFTSVFRCQVSHWIEKVCRTCQFVEGIEVTLLERPEGVAMVRRISFIAVLVCCLSCAHALATTSELYVLSRDNSGSLGYLTHLTISGNAVVAVGPLTSFVCPPARSGIAYTLMGDYVYVSCGTSVTAIRTADDVVVATIPLTVPGTLFVRPGDKQLFVAQADGATIVNIPLQPDGSRTNTVLKTITYPRVETTTALLFNKFMFAATEASVFKYDSNKTPAKFLADRQFPVRVQAVGVNADASKAYAFLASATDGIDVNGNILPAGNVHILRSSDLGLLSTLLCNLAEIESAAFVRKRYFYATQFDGAVCTVDTATVPTVVRSCVTTPNMSTDHGVW
jgi:hypothetical protein